MAIAQSRKVEISEIPVVDLGLLHQGAAAQARLFGEMRDACESVGFFYVKNHGVSSADTDIIFEQCRRFFAIPMAEREALILTRSPFYRGYLAIGARGANLDRPPDLLEAFNLGQDLGPDHPGVQAGKPLHGPNQWPSGLPGFREAVSAYQAVMFTLANKLLRALAGSLAISFESLAPYFEQPLSQMRLLHYPPQPSTLEHMMGARPHQDTSFLTILLQDAAGGLEVEARNGEWLAAPPRSDMFVVNVGEYLELFTSGVYYPAKHRVVNRSGVDRYSVPFFMSPNFDTELKPLPQFATQAGARSFQPLHIGNDMARFFHSLWPSVAA
jgi:isopenicillin N synthase-like dioxygenase